MSKKEFKKDSLLTKESKFNKLISDIRKINIDEYGNIGDLAIEKLIKKFYNEK